MRITTVLVFLFLTQIAIAQSSTYQSDLAALRSVLQKMPSFKTQIKGEKQSYFNTLYARLAADTVGNSNSYQYFYNLSQLTFPLLDNHLGFYQVPDYNHFRTKQSIDSFVATKEFLDYPSTDLNIDSLQTELAKKPEDSLEGIYHYDKFYTVGLFKAGDNAYTGVVLSSEVNLWRKGQIAIHLYRYAPGLYKAIYGHPLYKYFMLQPIEKYQQGSLVNSHFYASYSQAAYSKNPQQVDHVNLPKSASKFAFRTINKRAQYLLIQSFQNNPITAKASQEFYDSIENSLTAPNLILDLRNNEGGAEKEMKKYLKLLKSYLKNGQLYVLLNNGTLSQAEIFTLKLKQLNNVTLLGQTTKGMLAYGSNYGKTEKLPSGKFAIYPTDMYNGAALLPYEGYGINPDIILSGDRNWVEQVVDLIKNK